MIAKAPFAKNGVMESYQRSCTDCTVPRAKPIGNKSPMRSPTRIRSGISEEILLVHETGFRTLYARAARSQKGMSATIPHVQLWQTENCRRLDYPRHRSSHRAVPYLVDAAFSSWRMKGKP
jgi:hypothetical protein